MTALLAAILEAVRARLINEASDIEDVRIATSLREIAAEIRERMDDARRQSESESE